jgi:AcrR family transcriptional regulator
MINYYFNSKNELLKIAVGRIMEDRANELKEIFNKPIPPKVKLIDFLTGMTEITLEYIDITKLIISYTVLDGNMTPCYFILPVVKEYYGEKRTETECRIVALQLISALQMIFFSSDQFVKYSGIDIKDKEQRKNLIHTLINLHLNE